MNWIKRLFGIKEVEEPKVVKTFRVSQLKTDVIDPIEIIKRRRATEFVEKETIRRQKQEDESSFLTSMAVAAVTDSTIAGALVGGDIFGAIVGDALNDNDSDPNSKDPGFDGGFGGGDFSGGGSGGSWDDSSSSSSDSYDSSSSYESGSSYDSSDSSSSDW